MHAYSRGITPLGVLAHKRYVLWNLANLDDVEEKQILDSGKDQTDVFSYHNQEKTSTFCSEEHRELGWNLQSLVSSRFEVHDQGLCNCEMKRAIDMDGAQNFKLCCIYEL